MLVKPNLSNISQPKSHTTKKPVYMKTIRKSTIEKSTPTKNVLSFSWMIRLLTLIL